MLKKIYSTDNNVSLGEALLHPLVKKEGDNSFLKSKFISRVPIGVAISRLLDTSSDYNSQNSAFGAYILVGKNCHPIIQSNHSIKWRRKEGKKRRRERKGEREGKGKGKGKGKG